MPAVTSSQSSIEPWVDEAISSTPVYDLHTHLYPPSFGPLMLWGIDELLNYHYLIAETFRLADISYERFWSLSKLEQNDLIWKTLFIENAPISEACRGVVTVLNRLGLDVREKNLSHVRDFFKSQKPADYVNRVFNLSNVHTVVMTNDVFDPVEREIWLKKPELDPRFKAVLRIDPLLQGWPKVAETLGSLGYSVSADFSEKTYREIRRFLSEWIARMKPLYLAVSLTPDWRYPDDSAATKVIQNCILPITKERDLPFALMIGVRRQVNPSLRLAGDAVGNADVSSVSRLCYENQRNRFLVTFLARENQHEAAVTARKHRNLMLFGCWWFVNNPSLIEEITRMRMELLGPSFIPQHSDARILDQIIYKWDHSRQIIAKVLKDKFHDIARSNWPVTREEIQRTASQYLSSSFQNFLTASL